MKLSFREPMNGLTHFVGILLAIAGLVTLLTRTSLPFTARHAVSFSIFGSAMILLYTFSTLYHWLNLKESTLEILRKIDHIMIFVFIAATYTPICLVTLGGGWGWSMFGSVWGLTLAGFVLKIFWLNAPRWLYTAIYLAMGWIIIIGIWPLIQVLAFGGLMWLLAGGIFYSIGAIIYGVKKPDPWPGIFGFHEIFHLFVLAGSFSHFWLMYLYV
jgi:hemolysin III